jgi:hypothetical protein
LAGTALGLAIPGTIALLNQWSGNCNNNGGILGGLFGGNNNCNNPYMQDTRAIAVLETQIQKLESERYTDAVGIDLYKQTVKENKEMTQQMRDNFFTAFSAIAALDKQVAVDKARTECQIECLSGRVSALEGITKLVVPNSSVCPGWGNVTVTPATTTTTG